MAISDGNENTLNGQVRTAAFTNTPPTSVLRNSRLFIRQSIAQSIYFAENWQPLQFTFSVANTDQVTPIFWNVELDTVSDKCYRKMIRGLAVYDDGDA